MLELLPCGVLKIHTRTYYVAWLPWYNCLTWHVLLPWFDNLTNDAVVDEQLHQLFDAYQKLKCLVHIRHGCVTSYMAPSLGAMTMA